MGNVILAGGGSSARFVEGQPCKPTTEVGGEAGAAPLRPRA